MTWTDLLTKSNGIVYFLFNLFPFLNAITQERDQVQSPGLEWWTRTHLPFGVSNWKMIFFFQMMNSTRDCWTQDPVCIYFFSVTGFRFVKSSSNLELEMCSQPETHVSQSCSHPNMWQECNEMCNKNTGISGMSMILWDRFNIRIFWI